MLDMPFFMTNPDWFYFDGERFRLTDAAPKEAQESIKYFYREEGEMLKGE